MEKASPLLSEGELAAFQAVLPELIEQVKNVPGLELVHQELADRLTRLINYNVRQGKQFRYNINPTTLPFSSKLNKVKDRIQSM